MRRTLLGLCAGLGLVFAPAVAGATVIVNFTGNVYNPGDSDCPPPGVGCENQDVDFEAALTISGDTLTIVLSNNSADTTAGPYSLLTSFYFAIAGSPTLTYTGASGDVCLASRTNPDDCTVTTNESDLRAFDDGDFTWQFRQGLTLQPGSTVLSYGVGTAGNNSLSPNGFSGNVVDGRDYGIYTGDIASQNLNGDLLVKTSITFTFTGVDGKTEDDISEQGLFGLGTQPDSTGFVPEPGVPLLLGLGLGAVAWLRGRRPA